MVCRGRSLKVAETKPWLSVSLLLRRHDLDHFTWELKGLTALYEMFSLLLYHSYLTFTHLITLYFCPHSNPHTLPSSEPRSIMYGKKLIVLKHVSTECEPALLFHKLGEFVLITSLPNNWSTEREKKSTLCPPPVSGNQVFVGVGLFLASSTGSERVLLRLYAYLDVT